MFIYKKEINKLKNILNLSFNNYKITFKEDIT